MNWKHILTAAVVLVLINPVALTPVAASSGGGLSDAASATVGVFGNDVPEDTAMFHAGGDSQPSWIVEVSSAEDVDQLQEWADREDDRRVIRTYNATNYSVVAAPTSAIKQSGFQRLMSSGDTLTSESYVASVDLNVRLERPEPVQLKDDREYQKPTLDWYANARGGEFGADGMAWDDDAPRSSLGDARSVMDADQVSENGSGVSIAVIDTGANVKDGEIYGNGTSGSDIRITDGYNVISGEEIDPANGTYDAIADGNGHGSWVSSSAAGAGAGDADREGVAPGSDLMVYKALADDGSGETADIAAAVARADAQGADIIVMSLGSPFHSDALSAEISGALTDGNVTGVYVASGNSYLTTRYITSPADAEDAIGVSATNTVAPEDAQKAYFANSGIDPGHASFGATRGATPDTAAPGMNVTAPVVTESGAVVNSTLSGTSMAAPLAAGVGALVLEAEPDLKGNHTAFRDRVVNSGAHTADIGVTESEGGMANADRAINGWTDDAPNRTVSQQAGDRDRGNRILAGDVGYRLHQIKSVASVFGLTIMPPMESAASSAATGVAGAA